MNESCPFHLYSNLISLAFADIELSMMSEIAVARLYPKLLYEFIVDLGYG